MENPQHNKWETDRLHKDEKSIGNYKLKQINKYINDKLILLGTPEESEFLKDWGGRVYC